MYIRGNKPKDGTTTVRLDDLRGCTGKQYYLGALKRKGFQAELLVLLEPWLSRRRAIREARKQGLV